jgi:seryl-tRNA synthetase|tara:strand:- start:410 stop:1657 length:1248 start_codon:yes stop_codon:yes gene_type:complete
MHDLKDIRKNIEIFKKKINQRNVQIDLEKLLTIDKDNREIIFKKEKLEQEKKLLSKTKDPKNFEKSKKISLDISKLEKNHLELKKKIKDILSSVPNLALDDVPIGKDEKSNKVIKKIGELKKFNFKVKPHTILGTTKKNMDFDLASKLSGARFVVLKENLALLERALINFMIDTHTEKFNYTEISPPIIVNESAMYGTGQLPKFEMDQYEIKTDKEDLRKFLIPTAEVSLTNLVRETILDIKDLPLRYVASTPCFRKEAGSYGKDTKGMMRQHQFYKVELVSIVNPKDCAKELDRMLNCAEEILKLLELPYQIVMLSTGDMGFSAEKTYDIETWIPSENKYREISSCSSCGTFQSKRMMARFKDNKDVKYVGTLNGSGLATGRLMISLLENYQNSDGSVTVPNILKKYMKNIEKI